MQTPLYNGELALDFDDGKHVYRVNGSVIPGVTTILAVINKPALMPWAAKMGAEWFAANVKPGETLDELSIKRIAEGIKKAHRAKSSEAADIGTLLHDFADKHGKGLSPALPVHPQAAAAAGQFIAWWQAHAVKPEHCERKLYSRRHRFAGTVDFVGVVDGELVVADYKTSSGLYDEMRLQLAGYCIALSEELGINFKRRYVLRFPKDGSGFEAHDLDKEPQAMERDKRGFLAALELYNTLKELKAA